MEEKQGKKTLLYNLAPNGMQVDRVYLTEVPNCDNSGVEYFIEYIEDFDNTDTKIPIGRCDLIMGNICFDTVGESAELSGISFRSLKLLCDWIETNLE